MDCKAAVEAFLDYSNSKNLSGRTVEFYSFCLCRLIKYLPEGIDVGEVSVQHLRKVSSELRNAVNLTTVNHVIRISRMFFKFLTEEETIEKNPALRWEYLKQPKLVIVPFSREQIGALLKAPDLDTFIGLRDACIMSVFADTGLRASECLGIRIADVDLDNRVIKIMGKGSRERIVPFGITSRAWLKSYMKKRLALDGLDYEDAGLLFITEYGDKMTVTHMDHRLKVYGKKAGITGVRVSNHTFRHFAAINYLRNGGDLFSLQRLLGHSSLEMVRRYSNYNDSDISKQHSKYSPLDRMVIDGDITTKPQQGNMKKGRKRIR